MPLRRPSSGRRGLRNACSWLVPASLAADSVSQAYVDFSLPAAAAIRSGEIAHVVEIIALDHGTGQAANAGHGTGSLAIDDLPAFQV